MSVVSLPRDVCRAATVAALVAIGFGSPINPLNAQAIGCSSAGSLSYKFQGFHIGVSLYADIPLRPYGLWTDGNLGYTWGSLPSTAASPTQQPTATKCDSVAQNSILQIQKLFSTSTPNVSGAATGGGFGGSGSGLLRPSSLRALAAGEVMVGFIDRGHFTTFHAFRWTQATGPVDLGTLDPPNNATRTSAATGTSADGSVVVGFSQINAADTRHAFRWTSSSGMVDLGAPAGATRDSRALAVNGAGDVIVGDGVFADQNAFTGFRSGAFRWTAAGGFQNLGALQPGYFSIATDVTADGSVIVGQGGVEVVVGGTSTNGSRAFRWTSATGMQPIGPLPGHSAALATGVSDNGKVVVGISAQSVLTYDLSVGHGTGTAFRWTEAGGIQDLRQLLVNAGVDLTGVQLVAATGVSPDGQYIVGNAIHSATPAGETRPFVAKFCDAAIGGACTPLVAPVASFQLATASPTSVSLAAGSSATSTLTISPANGFNQTVTFTCSGLPAESSCAFAPASLTPNGTAAVSTTLSISTSAPRRGSSVLTFPSTGMSALTFAIAALFFMMRRTRGRWVRPVAAIVALTVSIGSCSGGDGGTEPPPLTGGTPAGTYPVTVTATSGSGTSAITRSLTITLTVTR